MAEFSMSPSRPYLLRALYEWIVDNRCTPHLVVDARDARVRVPREFVKDGQIVLNINPGAVSNFHWDNDELSFTARFGGVARSLYIPMWAVLAIYARENGEGMGFGAAEPPTGVTPVTAEASGEAAVVDLIEKAEPIEKAESVEAGPEDEPTPPTPTKPPPRRGGLRVVK